MSLEDLGNIGELVAAIGVIASLIYLAVQIRQNTSNIDFNTKALRGSTYTSHLQLRNEFQDLMLQNELLGDIWMKGMYRPGALDEIEANYFRNLAFRFFHNYESLVLMHRLGLIEDELFQSLNEANSRIFVRPGLQVHWGRYRSQFAPSFQAFLDSLLLARQAAEAGTEQAAEQ